MSVRLCVEVHRAPPELIAGVLAALVEHNVELYRSGEVQRSPWQLRYVPDEHAPESILRDARVLMMRSYGSCGELAAAYAAWMVVHEHGSGTLELLSDGPASWHVVATKGRTVYDPQILGAR